MIELFPNSDISILYYILVFVLGTIAFSFLNVIVTQLPGKNKILAPGSVCPMCKQRRTAAESIPVAGWFVNKRHCRNCSEKISIRQPLVELFGGVLAALLLPCYGLSLSMLLMFALYFILVTIALIDADTQEIPPILNISIAVLGVLSYFIMPDGPSIGSRIIGFFAISLPLYIIVCIVPDAFGGGDIKMMAAIGLFLGWKGTVFAFVVGLILGGAYGAYLLIAKKAEKTEHFAFGPFLSFGIAVAAYAGVGAISTQTGAR